TRSGDERGTCADGDARRNGLRAERGEQRRNHATALERAEDCDIELGNAAAQDEHALARGYAEIRQYVSEAAGFAIQLRIGEFARSAGSAEPADRDVIRAPAYRMPAHGFVCDIDRTVRQTGQLRARSSPAEARACLVVASEVRLRPA